MQPSRDQQQRFPFNTCLHRGGASFEARVPETSPENATFDEQKWGLVKERLGLKFGFRSAQCGSYTEMLRNLGEELLKHKAAALQSLRKESIFEIRNLCNTLLYIVLDKIRYFRDEPLQGSSRSWTELFLESYVNYRAISQYDFGAEDSGYRLSNTSVFGIMPKDMYLCLEAAHVLVQMNRYPDAYPRPTDCNHPFYFSELAESSRILQLTYLFRSCPEFMKFQELLGRLSSPSVDV